MVAKLIGIGAAGNKAAICAIEAGVIKKEDVLLINSTLKDIPHDYDGTKYCFDKAYGGCGKERGVAKNHMLADLQSGSLNIKEFLGINTGNKTEFVVLVSSTEGGTGSGSVPILAKYIKSACGVAVRCFSFVGFADDIRGLRNTVEYFQELEDNMAVESVSNLKYMDEANGDKLVAEKLANKDFCVKLSVILGNFIRESEHNIDPRDHLKIISTPNYSVTEYREFSKIKSKKEFKDMVQDMVNSSKCIDLTKPSQSRLAVIVNIAADSTGIIEYNDVLMSHFGEAFEKFEHIQHEKSMPEFFAFISVGNKMPTEEIEEIYEEYQARANKMVVDPDEFFAKDFGFDDTDNQFDLKDEQTMSDADFFSEFGMSSKTVEKPSKKKGATATTEDPY